MVQAGRAGRDAGRDADAPGAIGPGRLPPCVRQALAPAARGVPARCRQARCGDSYGGRRAPAWQTRRGWGRGWRIFMRNISIMRKSI